MKFLTDLFSELVAFFHKPAVEAAFTEVAQIVPIAQPIVAAIAALTPNRTVTEIAQAFAKYGVAFSSISSDPTSAENALFNLATQVVLKNLKSPAAVNLINTAVQIAVTALKAGG